MRAGWIVIALVACSSAAPPPPAAPKGPTACARAADSMVQVMLDRLAAVGRVGSKDEPTEAADALRNLIRERCEQDAWSAEATQCLIAMKITDDAAACAPHLTEAQQAALVRDQQEASGKPSKLNGNAAPATPRAGGD